MQFKFTDVAQKFNISNFVVYCCLLVFSILLSLRADHVITWNLGLVFFPIWLWNITTLAGLVVGVAVWIKKKNLRQDSDHRRYFIAMVQCSILQVPLFLTELLIAINAETGRHVWTAIFTPMYLLSLLSIGACVLSCCLKRFNTEFEFLSMVNLLQLLFIGVRLDGFVSWSWAVVLIPTWILVIVLSVCLVVYACLKCCLIKAAAADANNQENVPLQKLFTVLNVISFIISLLSFTLFLGLLTAQLDGRLSAPYSATFVPLHISILCLLVTTLTRQSANPWWFGLHKTFLDFILDACSPLQVYANISFTHRDTDSLEGKPGRLGKNSKCVAVKLADQPNDRVYPYEDLMQPD